MMKDLKNMFKPALLLISACVIALATAFPAVSYEFPNTEARIVNTEKGAKPYKLFIYTPDAPAPKNGYPVIYVLDGNSVFGTMIDEIRRRTVLKYGDPAVIVAIGYPEDDPWNVRRWRDLTPWLPKDFKKDKEKNIPLPGGADDFLDIIKTHIIPSVEGDHNINPHRRTLAGHSFGGLFTMHAFFMKTGLFQNYAAASPSIWFANEQLFEEFEEYAIKHRKKPDTARLLMLPGGCEETPGECDPARPPAPLTDDWIVKTGKMVSNSKKMYHKLHKLRGADVSLRILEGENHTSVIGGALSWTAAFAMTSPDTSTPTQPE